MKKSKIAFVFDLDGTIIQSEEIKALSHEKSIEAFGGNTPRENYKLCIGNSFEVVAKNFIEKSGIHIDINQYKDKFTKIYLDLLLQNIKLVDGFLDFKEEIKNFKKGLVTSSDRIIVDKILEKFHITDFFDAIVTKDDVIHEKPHPEPYLLIKEKLEASSIIVFEDTTAGFISASAITNNIIAIKHLYNTLQDFSYAQATYSNFIEIDIEKIS